MKTHFPKLKPNVNYRDYKGFVSNIINFKDLQYTLQRILDKHPSLKKRFVKSNQQNFVDKELKHAIMVRDLS